MQIVGLVKSEQVSVFACLSLSPCPGGQTNRGRQMAVAGPCSTFRFHVVMDDDPRGSQPASQAALRGLFSEHSSIPVTGH